MKSKARLAHHKGLNFPHNRIKRRSRARQTWGHMTEGDDDNSNKSYIYYTLAALWRIPTDREAWRPTVHRIAKSWT